MVDISSLQLVQAAEFSVVEHVPIWQVSHLSPDMKVPGGHLGSASGTSCGNFHSEIKKQTCELTEKF